MTQRPDLRGHAAAIEEGVVRGYAAIVVEAHDLAEVALHVLRGRELLALAGRDPQLAVRPEGEAMPPVAAAVDLGHLSPDHGEIFERAASAREYQPGARH